MDPQERLFLECAYETLQDAGYPPRTLAGTASGSGPSLEGAAVGVFAGVMYEEYQLFGNASNNGQHLPALPGNPSSVANRVSFTFDFNGPSMAVDTMCSSSLTTIHLACRSILDGECELALAGGVNVSLHPNKYLVLSQGRYASAKGRCETFGKGADGYVPGEGVGAVLLKPLEKALEDQDRVYAVILSSAVNHGGRTNGYSVPNPKAQTRVVEKALDRAGIDPRAVSYIEAHGTGTFLGDPIEIQSLARAFSKFTRDTGFCAIGSVKSNIGHLESAAGIAGVTKILLQMKHGKLAPSLHSGTLNPHIDFEATPFRVQQRLAEWKRPKIEQDGRVHESPRIACISAFGAGGANAHLVLCEPPPAVRSNAANTGTPSPNPPGSPFGQGQRRPGVKRPQDAGRPGSRNKSGPGR